LPFLRERSSLVRTDGGSEVVGTVDLPRGVPAVLWVLLLVGDASLLATSARPHFDVVLPDLTDPTIDRLVACFSTPMPNPGRR